MYSHSLNLWTRYKTDLGLLFRQYSLSLSYNKLPSSRVSVMLNGYPPLIIIIINICTIIMKKISSKNFWFKVLITSAGAYLLRYGFLIFGIDVLKNIISVESACYFFSLSFLRAIVCEIVDGLIPTVNLMDDGSSTSSDDSRSSVRSSPRPNSHGSGTRPSTPIDHRNPPWIHLMGFEPQNYLIIY